jgi:hypothetical protein
VAGSARGRELRAAAALARFEVKEDPQIKDEDLVTDSETDTEEDFVIKPEPDDAVDINGKRLLDRKGHGMVSKSGNLKCLPLGIQHLRALSAQAITN